MKRDCIIPGHLSTIDPVTSVLENGRIASSLDVSPKVIGSDYPVIVSSDFSRRECGRIASSLDIVLK